jgi:hypothetical protein
VPKQIGGNVCWIQDGSLTDRTVDVREAFTDPDQAKAQVVNAEASGSQKWIKLVRWGLTVSFRGRGIAGRIRCHEERQRM